MLVREHDSALKIKKDRQIVLDAQRLFLHKEDQPWKEPSPLCADM